MTTLKTALSGAAVITASTTPTMGSINTYNATSGALTPTLPALSSLNVGAWTLLEKDTQDTTYNTVTFSRNGTDTFYDASTTLVLSQPGERVYLEVISISGTKYWKITMAGSYKTGLMALTSEFNLNTSNAATDIISATLPAATLAAGSTFRINLFGTVQVTSTSGTLTFTPFIQGTALNTIQMASQTSAEGPVSFMLEIMITVRSTGSTGTAIAHGWGHIKFATNTALIISSTNTSTTTINTTSAASSTVIKAQAQFATSNASNILKIEVGTIERVI